MNERLKKVREISRMLDAAETERKKLTSEIDERINCLEAELADLINASELDLTRGAFNPTNERDSDDGNKTNGQVVLAILRANPKADNPTLMEKLSWDDTPRNRNRLRSLMHFLKQRKKVRRVPGKQARWEVD